MIVTVDGPAGAGKSSAARALADRLGFEYLDTGAMYRAVTLAGLQSHTDFHDAHAVNRLLSQIRIELPPGRVLLNGEEVSDAIRTSHVTRASSLAADNRTVRQHLVALQRAVTEGRNMVSEGRDQGTIVFPDALYKFFLVADPSERARRRQKEMESRGEVQSWEDVLRAQEERDRRDAARDLAPMVPAADALIIDNTHLTLEQVVDLLETHVRRRLAENVQSAKENLL
jgi:cytidylate kinase